MAPSCNLMKTAFLFFRRLIKCSSLSGQTIQCYRVLASTDQNTHLPASGEGQLNEGYGPFMFKDRTVPPTAIGMLPRSLRKSLDHVFSRRFLWWFLEHKWSMIKRSTRFQDEARWRLVVSCTRWCQQNGSDSLYRGKKWHPSVAEKTSLLIGSGVKLL